MTGAGFLLLDRITSTNQRRTWSGPRGDQKKYLETGQHSICQALRHVKLGLALPVHMQQRQRLNGIQQKRPCIPLYGRCVPELWTGSFTTRLPVTFATEVLIRKLIESEGKSEVFDRFLPDCDRVQVIDAKKSWRGHQYAINLSRRL